MGGGWVELEFPEIVTIDAVRWGRDREEKYRDRLAIEYTIAISTTTGDASASDGGWTIVATSRDRQPFAEGKEPTATFDHLPPAERAAAEALAAVRRALEEALPGDLRVLSKPELEAFERAFQADLSSAGPIFWMGTIVGFIVGMLIAYQIIYTDLSDQLPQYATLKGMGYGSFYLVRVVFQQAAFTAVAAYVPAVELDGDRVGADRSRRTAGSVESALTKLVGGFGPIAGDALAISAATGCAGITAEEAAALKAAAPTARRIAAGDLVGHGVEAAFPVSVALAAIALSAGQAREAVVTGAGHWRGEGAAHLVQA